MNEKDLLENEELGRWALLLLLLAIPNKNFEKELEAGNFDENHINCRKEQKEEE